MATLGSAGRTRRWPQTQLCGYIERATYATVIGPGRGDSGLGGWLRVRIWIECTGRAGAMEPQSRENLDAAVDILGHGDVNTEGERMEKV
jgi:hypothetical protein